jgi:hypothetical protein
MLFIAAAAGFCAKIVRFRDMSTVTLRNCFTVAAFYFHGTVRVAGVPVSAYCNSQIFFLLAWVFPSQILSVRCWTSNASIPSPCSPPSLSAAVPIR